jgi:hypothetical protein
MVAISLHSSLMELPPAGELSELPLATELWIVGITLAVLVWAFRRVSARQAESYRRAEEISARARHSEVEAEHDLFRTALVELAYDPGWPEDPRKRVEEMKHFALYTLRAATMTEIPKMERPADAMR